MSWQSNGSEIILKLFTLFFSIFLILLRIISNTLSVDSQNLFLWLLTFLFPLFFFFFFHRFDFRAIFMLIYDCKWNSNKLKWKCSQSCESCDGCTERIGRVKKNSFRDAWCDKFLWWLFIPLKKYLLCGWCAFSHMLQLSIDFCMYANMRIIYFKFDFVYLALSRDLNGSHPTAFSHYFLFKITTVVEGTFLCVFLFWLC